MNKRMTTNYRQIFFFWTLCFIIKTIFPTGLYSQEATESDRLPSMPISVYAYFGTISNTDYRLKHNSKTYERGEISDYVKNKIGINAPVWQGRFYAFSLAAHHGYYHQNASINEMLTEERTVDLGENHHTWEVGLNGVVYGKVFNKPLITNVKFSVDGSEHGFEQYSGRVAALLQMKRTPTSSWGIGMIGLINSTISFPFIPFMTYSHKFDPQWSLSIALPQANLRYSLHEKHHFSIGVHFDNDYFYIHPEKENIPDVLVYSKVLVNPGITYECPISPHFYLTVRGGSSHLLSGRIYDKKHPKEYSRIYQPASAFFNVGVSYNLPRVLR